MKRVLVIEDDDNNLLLITTLLENGGFEVVKARSGEEGLQLAFSVEPDFVILDIGLPGMDGTEVLERLRASELDGDLPVIAMTSYAMTGDRQRMMDAGCNGYIEKPINPREVVAQIRRLLPPSW